MKADILNCKNLSCNGVVFGMLNADGTVDKRCAELVDSAYPMETTFHRAFDRVKDATKSLEEIIKMGFNRVLTSGLHPTALEGMDTIRSLIKQAGKRIIIMPGSGVRSGNIFELIKSTGATEFHTSARINSNSKMNFTNEALKEVVLSVTVDEKEVNKIIEILHSN